MNELVPVQTTNHPTRRREHLPAALGSATHVFVRRDAKAPPLTRPYTGPFRVIEKNEKYFELEMNGKRDRVTVDRLKPAYLEREDSAIVCYGPEIESSDVRDRKIAPTNTTQPTIQKSKRGRPSRVILEERRRLAEKEQERERERDDENDSDRKANDFSTRYGRVSRPPDRF